MSPARLSSFVFLLLVGCGGALPAPVTPTPVAAQPAVAVFPGTFLDAQDRVVPPAEVLARLEAARVVYVGELHDSPDSHALELAVIRALSDRDPSVAVGLEMVQRPFQAGLDDYIAGRTSEAQLLTAIEWAARWGFTFDLYRAIFKLARARHLPLRALNARMELTRRIGREGLAALTPAETAELPEMDANDPAHRALVLSMLGDHPGLDDAMRERFYQAQLVWDETMATEVARALSAPDAPRHLVVLAGTGHVRAGLGIPKRAARRAPAAFVTVLPASECEAASDADLRWRP